MLGALRVWSHGRRFDAHRSGRRVMLAKCSNLSCSAPFRHLQDRTIALRISKEENEVTGCVTSATSYCSPMGMISISSEQQEG